MDLIAGINNIQPLNKQEITVEGIDPNDLIIRWLNELIYIFAVKKMLFSKFEIIDLSDLKLHCKAYGELLDEEKHSVKEEIKAATYHNLTIEKLDNKYTATIIFDV